MLFLQQLAQRDQRVEAVVVPEATKLAQAKGEFVLVRDNLGTLTILSTFERRALLHQMMTFMPISSLFSAKCFNMRVSDQSDNKLERRLERRNTHVKGGGRKPFEPLAPSETSSSSA